MNSYNNPYRAVFEKCVTKSKKKFDETIKKERETKKNPNEKSSRFRYLTQKRSIQMMEKKKTTKLQSKIKGENQQSQHPDV